LFRQSSMAPRNWSKESNQVEFKDQEFHGDDKVLVSWCLCKIHP
jgi:hypothetical protein